MIKFFLSKKLQITKINQKISVLGKKKDGKYVFSSNMNKKKQEHEFRKKIRQKNEVENLKNEISTFDIKFSLLSGLISRNKKILTKIYLFRCIKNL